MEQTKIQPSVTLYSWTDQTWYNWLRRRPLLVCQFWLNLVGWEIPRKYVKYNFSVTFCSVPFVSCTLLEQKPMNGFARSMAQNAWNQARMCLLGVSLKKFHPHPQYPPNSENFALRKQFFTKITYKSWRKLHQNSYLNRKQPMTISNFGLKIWPEVEFWPFLHMRSRKLAKN